MTRRSKSANYVQIEELIGIQRDCRERILLMREIAAVEEAMGLWEVVE